MTSNLVKKGVVLRMQTVSTNSTRVMTVNSIQTMRDTARWLVHLTTTKMI